MDQRSITCYLQSFKNCYGSTLLEIIFVILIVGFLVLVVGNLPSSINLVRFSYHTSLAREIASTKINDLRAQTYANLADGTSLITDVKLQNLPLGTGKVNITDCSTDVCPSQIEKTKQVTVTISWQEINAAKQIRLTTLVSQGGL